MGFHDFFNSKIVGTIYKLHDKVELKIAKHVKIDDLRHLSYPYHELYTSEILKSNDFYGHATILKEYGNMNKKVPVKASIEHAVYFGVTNWDGETNNNMPVVIAQGNIRKEKLANCKDKKVCAIGTYITYANDYLTPNQFEKLKQKLGKVLMVFPMHSTHHVDVDFEMEPFIDEIEKLKGNYDTVCICMYWKDILRKRHILYKKKGYKIVSAGHMYDPTFLLRLKSIIKLSDMVMSNDVGSYVGQAISLDKPVYLYRQDYKSSGDGYDEEYVMRLKDKDYCRMFEIFGNYSTEISQEQYQTADWFWGVHSTLSPDELHKLLFEMEQNYNEKMNE